MKAHINDTKKLTPEEAIRTKQMALKSFMYEVYNMGNKVEYRFVIRNNKTGTFLRKDSLKLISFITRGDALNYLLNNDFDISNYTILDWRNI